MTIKLNEFDRKLLSSIKPSDNWNKLKNIYTINGEVKRLKIGNNKIGTKCAQHLKKLSNKSEVTLNEIKDSCKDLIPKKHKHGLAKDKTKKEVLKEHTKLDIGQDKPPPPKVKKPPKPRKPSATQQLVNLLSQQQLIAKKQTVQRQIQEVDTILTDRNKNVELPNQTPQISQLQLTRQSLGQQRQIGGLGIYAPLPRRPPRPSMPAVTQNINGNVVGTTKKDEEILNQLRQNNQERLQQIESIQQPAFSSFTSKLVKEDNLKRQNEILDDITILGQIQRTKKNQKIFEDISKKVETTKQIDQNLDFLNELKAEITQQRFIADTEKRQDESLNEAMNIMRERERKKKKDALGTLGLERTTSASLLERMERDSSRQSLENEELQRTLSATIESQVLDVGREERKQEVMRAIRERDALLELTKPKVKELKSIAQEEPSMEEKPSPREEEVAMKSTPYYEKIDPLKSDTTMSKILKSQINKYNEEWVEDGRPERVLQSETDSAVLGSIALMGIKERDEERFSNALKDKSIMEVVKMYDERANETNSSFKNQRDPNYVNKKRLNQYKEDFKNLAEAQRGSEEDDTYLEKNYNLGTEEAGESIGYLKDSLNQYRNTGSFEPQFDSNEDAVELTKAELKKLKPQELNKLIKLTNKLDNDLGYEDGGVFRVYGKKTYNNALQSKNELYSYAESINVNVDTLAQQEIHGHETINSNLPVFSD
tara:strand:- start:4037 stop:6175 length:2139 start_codon:yes stop_codon:yes gene_type:complete